MNPCHPGEILRESVSENGWTVTEFAKRLGVARNTASKLLNGRSGITPAIALGLERIGWSEADYWMRMQVNYNLAAARRKLQADRKLEADKRNDMIHYPALLDGEDGAYGVVFPDLPGAGAMGYTVDDVLVNAEDVLRDYAIVLNEDGLEIPPPSSPHSIEIPPDSRLVSIPLNLPVETSPEANRA